MNAEFLLDARGMEPPEPMEKAMQVLAALQSGQHLRMLLHREPYPLYAILEHRGYRHETVLQLDGSYEILIQAAEPSTGRPQSDLT